MREMSKEEIKKLDKEHVLHSWSVQGTLDPTVVTKAEGIYFYDADGKKYYDMSSQLVNLNIGYGNQKVADAIAEQAHKLPFIGPGYAVDVKSELARKIIELAPDNMQKVFFTLGGADANENALKIARLYTGRNKVMSRYRSYHGSTMGAGNLTGEPRRFNCEPGIPGYVKFFDPYVYRELVDFEDDAAATKFYIGKLREQIIYEGPESIAAIECETITGSNGCIIPPDGYLQGIRDLCDEFGIMMICDEVMMGWCRTGEVFACQNWGIKPDIITFAKGVTCGYSPLGGVIVDKKIADYFDDHKLLCGLTYSGHPLSCAAGVATLDVYKEDHILDNVRAMGKILGEIEEDLKEKHACVGDVRYKGLFSAVELVKDKATKEPLVGYNADKENLMGKICGMLKAKGFSTYTHENIIIVAPPLIIKEDELRTAMTMLDEVLTEVDKMIA
ncbi:MAG: aminotransferase class III-fold pyridoxal phosphate-dependent enzyme [Lachnospiraceae bacterium]|nr:aminotransferase class III-fold pyridoxal phosphate-dependent enzyme [Lachnospiraceae bacterium]